MSGNSPIFFQIPQNFQSELFKEISQAVKQNESVQLVGVPGSGSTIIAKALYQNPDIQERYFGSGRVFVLLDGAALLEQNSLSLTRLLLKQLNPSCIHHDSSLILKALEEEIDNVCQENKLVLIIDHINFINSAELSQFYINLYHIIRNCGGSISLVIFSEGKISDTQDLANFGVFARYLTQNIFEIPKLDNTDSKWFISEKVRMSGVRLSGEEIAKVIELSGGFPRTMKRMVEALGRGCKLSELVDDPSRDYSLGMHLNELANYAIKLPIMENLGHKQAPEEFPGVKIPQLTKNEYEVFAYLFANKGKLVDRDSVIEKIWGKKALEISDHAYDQIIHRLRNKIGFTNTKAEIKTVKGRGHCLLLR